MRRLTLAPTTRLAALALLAGAVARDLLECGFMTWFSVVVSQVLSMLGLTRTPQPVGVEACPPPCPSTREVAVEEGPAAYMPRFWWLREGAPEARLTLATNRTTRMIDGCVLRFSRDIRGLEVRTAGFGDGDRGWRAIGRG